MNNKAAISLSTGLEDAEKVTVALLVAVGAAESGRPTITFLTKEAVRIALEGTAIGTACDGCPSIPDLMKRYDDAGGQLPAQTRNTNHVELVQVRAEDCQKLDALEQRIPLVEGLVKHLRIELQPAQLAIDEQRWIGYHLGINLE